MGTNYNPKIVTDGLVLCLDAGNTKSYPGNGATWYDLSGNGNNATLYNAPSFSAGVVSFNGTNQYAQANISTTALDGDPLMTVDFFVKRTSNFSNSGFWGVGGSGQGKAIEGWTPTATRIHLDLYDSSRLDTGVDYPLNKYVHVSWVKFGSLVTVPTVACYVNGVVTSLTQTRSQTTGPNLNTSTAGKGVTLGRICGDQDLFYAPITMGAFHVYSRALSASEIAQNFNALRGRFGI